MARTRAQLIEQIRAKLKESTPRFWTNDDLLIFVNDGERDLGEVMRLAGSDTRTSVLGQQEYDLPADLMELEEVRFSGIADPLTETFFEQRETESDEPEKYYTRYDKLGISPPPNSGHSGKTITVYYRRRIGIAATDATEPEIPEDYREALVHYGLARALEQDEQEARAAWYLEQYERAKTRLNFFQKQETRRVRSFEMGVVR